MQCLEVDLITAMESGFVFFNSFILSFFLAPLIMESSTNQTRTYSGIFVLGTSQRFTMNVVGYLPG